MPEKKIVKVPYKHGFGGGIRLGSLEKTLDDMEDWSVVGTIEGSERTQAVILEKLNNTN